MAQLHHLVKEFDLVVGPVKLSLRGGKVTIRWAYNGQIPGSVLRVKLGDRIVQDLTLTGLVEIFQKNNPQ